MSDVAEIKVMWEEWRGLPFPAECAGKEVEGICLASIDSYAAGCIDTFVSRDGRLDAGRISILEDCRRELEIVLESLGGDAKRYFEGLLLLSERVLSQAGR